MPIYEFYCRKCNTLFNFFSRTLTIKKSPVCPKCCGELQKQVSLFSTINTARNEDSPGDIPIDEARLEKTMTKLASEAGSFNDENPKQAAELMKKFSDLTGVKLGNGMQEALNRMGQGEDPEKIEAELGDVIEQEDLFCTQSNTGGPDSTAKKIGPLRDDTLYEL